MLDKRLVTFWPPAMHAFLMKEAASKETNVSALLRDLVREKYPQTREMLSTKERERAA